MKTLSSQAHAAKLIRQELKQAFPETKFKVTSTSYSMGDAVYIHWTDGPTVDQVDEISDKYQYGHFNGMEDIYEHSNRRTDIPQTKFVQTTRELSNDAHQTVWELFTSKIAGLEACENLDHWIVYHGRGTTPKQENYRVLTKLDLTTPITKERILEVIY